jgi:hypothetical protein
MQTNLKFWVGVTPYFVLHIYFSYLEICVGGGVVEGDFGFTLSLGQR